MNADSKRNLLAAFDALAHIEAGRSPGPRTSSHGGSMKCDCCGESLASGRHADGCPIHAAIVALSPLLPRWENREQWLAEGEVKP